MKACADSSRLSISSTGKEVWRFWTVPKPGEPGLGNLEGQRRSSIGAGATWMTGTYDPQLDTVYWPVGNPVRISTATIATATTSTPIRILALDAKTGKLKWHYQFTPHDVHDWDAQEPPVLVDTNWQGQPRKLLMQANRNGFFYVLDRTNWPVAAGKQFMKKLNWAKEIGKDGRPIMKDLPRARRMARPTCVPEFQGGTNWYSTSFNPGDRACTTFRRWSAAIYFSKRDMEWQAGKGYMGGAARPAPGETFEKSCARSIFRPARSFGTAAGERHGSDGFGGRDVDRVGPGVLRRKQRVVHGSRRGERQSRCGSFRPIRCGRRRP